LEIFANMVQQSRQPLGEIAFAHVSVCSVGGQQPLVWLEQAVVAFVDVLIFFDQLITDLQQK
jgi:hypothetical protein